MLRETRLLVYLSPHGGSAFLGHSRRLEWLGELPEADGPLVLTRLADTHPHAPVMLIVDSVDEDFRLESLPHVSGPARAEMVARRLRQLYRNSPFCAAWRQGRLNQGRRDDRYLMVSLIDHDWLAPWIAALRERRAPLMAVTLVSAALQALYARLKLRETHGLLATPLPAGLRLCYFQQGQLRFSRLSPNEDNRSSNAAEEIAKTQLYLSSQRILLKEVRLPVHLVNLGTAASGIAQSLAAEPAFEPHVVSPAELAHALRVPADFFASQPETLPLAALADGAPVYNLARAELTAPYLLHRIGRGVKLAAAAVLGAGLSFAGHNLWQAHDLEQQAKALQDSARATARQAGLTRTPQMPADPDTLARVAHLSQRLSATQIPPAAVLGAVGTALAQNPAIRLEKLDWRDDALGHPAAGARVEIEARIEPFDGNWRAAAQKIDALRASLARQPGVTQIKLTQTPMSDHDATLSGSTLTDGAPREARFRLEFHLGATT